MNDLFNQTVFWVSLFAGITSILSFLISHFIYRKRKEKLSEKIEESKLNEVIKSNDIKKLGQYLDDSLLKVTISQYSSSSSVSSRVNRYLDLLKEFVGTTEEIKKDSQEIANFKKESKDTGFKNQYKHLVKSEEINPEIHLILDELENGEVWNALARLRRFIEIELRKIAKSLNIMVRTKNVSSGQLLNQLFRQEIIDLPIYTDLKLSISVCNQAVHGLDVEYNEALEATNHAISAWKLLKEKYPDL